MPGINTGILTNAYPLTASQISELEKFVLDEQQAAVYLDENSELCFALPSGVDNLAEDIKELAWGYAYELGKKDDTLTNRAYKRTGLKSFYLEKTLQKQSYEDTWRPVATDYSEEANGSGTTIIVTSYTTEANTFGTTVII